MSERPPEVDGLTYVRPLGSGGYAQVHLYDQHFPKRFVAVKVLKRNGMGDELRSALTAEANAMAGVSDHPNIVPVFSAGVTADGSPYLVMMYYPNGSLATIVQAERLDVASVLRIGIQIGSAVESAHRAGILHRDIKPANILVSQYGGTGLTDFGIAAQMHHMDEDDEAGVSVPWSAPEILYATGPASVQSDVYSLAATVWHLLTGHSPYEVLGGDNSPFALMRRIRDNQPPETGRPDVPPALERLLRQSLAKNPANRPSTALDFARSLQAIEATMALPRTDIIVLSEPSAPVTRPPVLDFRPPPATAPAATDASSRSASQGYGPAGGDRPPSLPPTFQPATRQRTIQPVAAQAPPPGSGTGARTGSGLRTETLPSFQSEVIRRPEPNTLGPRSGYAPAGLPGSGQQTGMPAASPPATGPAPTPAASHQHRADRRRSVRAFAASAGLLGVALIAGYVVLSHPSHHSGPTATVASGIDTNVLPKAAPPGTPNIVGTRVTTTSATVDQFRWSYDNALSTDRFSWKETTGRRAGTTTVPRLTLSPSAGPRTCISVKVIRADGTDAALDWSPAGCVS